MRNHHMKLYNGAWKQEPVMSDLVPAHLILYLLAGIWLCCCFLWVCVCVYVVVVVVLYIYFHVDPFICWLC